MPLKTSPEHLPEHIQAELKSITETIVNMIMPEMIILFGSYSRGNYVEQHRYIENGITYEYKSDFDILVVTAKPQDMPPRLAKEIRRRVKRAENMQTTPHIIFHDINYINKELSDGHYFFTDIVREGTLLYNTGTYELAEPRILSPKDRQHKANIYFKEWFKSANGFFRFYEVGFEEENYTGAIFQLHQATERYFMAILLVFTDYKPVTHDLERLNREAGYCDIRVKAVFPNHTDEEKRLFLLLVKAYIDSRYKLGYTINPEDLQYLATRVKELQQLTEEICKEKIDSYAKSLNRD